MSIFPSKTLVSWMLHKIIKKPLKSLKFWIISSPLSLDIVFDKFNKKKISYYLPPKTC